MTASRLHGTVRPGVCRVGFRILPERIRQSRLRDARMDPRHLRSAHMDVNLDGSNITGGIELTVTDTSRIASNLPSSHCPPACGRSFCRSSSRVSDCGGPCEFDGGPASLRVRCRRDVDEDDWPQSELSRGDSRAPTRESSTRVTCRPDAAAPDQLSRASSPRSRSVGILAPRLSPGHGDPDAGAET